MLKRITSTADFLAMIYGRLFFMITRGIGEIYNYTVRLHVACVGRLVQLDIFEKAHDDL